MRSAPGGFFIELTSDGSTPRFASFLLLLFCLPARELLRCRGLSCRFFAFGFRCCGLRASSFLTDGLCTLRLRLCCRRCLDTSGLLRYCLSTLHLQLCRSASRGFDARRCFPTRSLLALRLQLRCSRCLDTSGFLTGRQQTLRLQLSRSLACGFEARRHFLPSGLLPLYLLPFGLNLCCSQLRSLLALGLHARGLDACCFFPKIGFAFRCLDPRCLDPRCLQLFRLPGRFSGSLPLVLCDSLPCRIAGMWMRRHHGLRA